MRKRLLSILLLCALLAGSASAAQLPAEDAASPDVLSAGERITGAGIDVSQYQGVIDWDTTAQYIDFAIIRCGRGSDLTAQDDTKWAVNTAACERLGIPYGVYLYSLAQTDEEARSEAAHALRLLDGKHPQLPVYLDLEDSGIRDNCTKAEVLRHATIFCETLQAAGYSVGVYANRYWWTTTLDDPAYDRWDRWLAVWAAETGYSGSYSTWQNSNSGRIPGIQANVDLDLRYGASLRADHTHDYRITEHVALTCTDFGQNVYTCVGCGASVTQPLRPLGGEHVWDGGTVVQQASCAGDGVRRYTCTRCGTTRTETIPAPSCSSKDLTDVPAPDNWAHAGIDYCVRSGLMSGVGGGRFDPKGTTTRAQVVQILYNLAGGPKAARHHTVYGSDAGLVQGCRPLGLSGRRRGRDERDDLRPRGPGDTRAVRCSAHGICKPGPEAGAYLDTRGPEPLPGQWQRVRLGAGCAGRRGRARADLRHDRRQWHRLAEPAEQRCARAVRRHPDGIL